MSSNTRELENLAPAQYVATLLDDLITWRTIGNKSIDGRGTSNIQPHGGAWIPADRSFDRILFWRTGENNSFQLVEYSMSRNLSHNAVQLHFANPTTVLPNVFIVELPNQQEICLMFATHLGVYRWILKHPINTAVGQLEQSQSILAEINEDFLHDRNHFHRHDLQFYGQVNCSFTNDHLIYALHNEMETIILRFDNGPSLNSPQQFTFPKRQSTGLFTFLWNPNKSVSTNAPNQPLIVGQTTINDNGSARTVILYDNGLLRFLSDQIDLVLFEYNISDDLTQSVSKLATKMFLDYSQYVTFADEMITRLFIILDNNDSLHLLIYEFQYDRANQLQFSLYQKKSYAKIAHSTDQSNLPHGSSLTSITCTNDRLTLHFLTNQNRSILFLIQYELKNHLREQFLPLPIDKAEKYIHGDSATIDDIERQFNFPGQYTVDMIKEALWITFNLNLDEYGQSWASTTQVLQQLPSILHSLCNDHCDEQSIRIDDRVQVLTKFWQNLYSTLIDLRAQALVLLACRIFDERQMIIVVHKSAVSFYSMSKLTPSFNPRYSRFVKDVEALVQISDNETIERIDDAVFNDTTFNTQQLLRLQKSLEPVANNDQLIETFQSMFDKSSRRIFSNENENPIWTSKIARRLLVLVFIQLSQERLEQIERLSKLIPLVFRSNDHHIRINSQRLDRIQEKVLPYLQDLFQVYQILLWLSSCVVEFSTDDRDLFIENLLNQQTEHQYKTRLTNQSLLEQILIDRVQNDRNQPDADNWFQLMINTVENLFDLLWPSDDFLIVYLSSRHQWSILDQYCSRLTWFKELNYTRQFFHALSFYRSGCNIDTATRYLAAALEELDKDPLLIKLFGRQNCPELFYIEWIREYLKYFGQDQHVAAFLHQSLQNSHSNDRRALITKELFKTSLDLKNFDDAFWCIQNTNDFLSQKQFTFDYALAICSLSLDQSLYRLQTLVQYQRDKLGHIDLELLAYIERTCVEQQPIQSSHVKALYEIYKMIKLPLKMAQIMYHYACSITDIREQKDALQSALNALKSIPIDNDPTDRLFIYPINHEYNFVAPLNSDLHGVRLIGLQECRQKLATISAIYTLKTDRASANIQVTDTMHPTQLSGLLTKFHHNNEAQQLLEAFQ